MLPRHPHLFRLAIFGALVGAALLMLPRSAAFAAAVAVYRGDAPAATGPARKIELRLSADGTMSFTSDFRNNKAPVTEEGRWIPVSPKPGELVVNIGDMLQRLTNGMLRSTTHRVVNPPPQRRGFSRYSMPFFLHFRSDFLIEALPGTVPPDEQPKWPPITANDYLQERLREIKLT